MNQIIAMSFPSRGILSWYRNSIKEVAAFLKGEVTFGLWPGVEVRPSAPRPF